MKISLVLKIDLLKKIFRHYNTIHWKFLVIIPTVFISVVSTLYFYNQGTLIAYGDSESHLNIAKRVVSGYTSGLAQLGGIWLPLPHILMLPFVYFDILWRTGLAGSIISAISFIFSAIYIYKLVLFLTDSKSSSILSVLVFITNPNILYLQSTAMTESLLIVFFIISTYYLFVFLKSNELFSLLLSALFGFMATLTRYDGWFLVLIEALAIFIFYFKKKKTFKNIEGTLILFSTLAFFGIFLWLFWDYLILGVPLYFTSSEFSAKSQQMNWLKKGELPAYHNIFLSFFYYFFTAMSSSGILFFTVFLWGVVVFVNKRIETIVYLIVLLTPFIFNVLTLFLGQSVIFIPHLTPVDFEWRLFNVRYGVMTLPAVAILVGFVFSRINLINKLLLLLIFPLQVFFYISGYSKVIVYQDGVAGLSAAKKPDAEYWMAKNYDNGLVLMDDFARTISIIRSNIPMQNLIYVGTKPYWEESLREPEKYADWVVMQKDDAVWRKIYDDESLRGRLYAHFTKVYTSPDILIFKRQDKTF